MNFNEVFSFHNLYKSYKECCKGVRWKTSTKNYIQKSVEYISKTRQELLSGKYKSKGFTNFVRTERGKARKIKAIVIGERVVQKCLCDNWLIPLLSKRLIYDNGATLKGKGTNFTCNRIKCHLQRYFRKYGNSGYVLTFDFHHYFDTIDHEILLKNVRKIADDDKLFSLYSYFILNFGDVGIGLGSQVSQISALFYLNKFDHYLKEQKHCEFYGRYMDDGYIISNDKMFLNSCLCDIMRIAQKLKLELNTKKTKIVDLKNFQILNKHWKLKSSGYVQVSPLHKMIYGLRRKFRKLVEKYTDMASKFIQQFLSSLKGTLKYFRNRRLLNYVYNERTTNSCCEWQNQG